jgi:hypothetical protein
MFPTAERDLRDDAWARFALPTLHFSLRSVRSAH